MTTALEKLEATISEIDGPAKADYRELVHGLVLRPDDMPDVKRVRKILDTCGKSLDDLKADVLKLRNCYEVELRIADAEKAREKIPELKAQAAAAEQRVLKAKEKLLPIITEGAEEMNRLDDAIHRIEVTLQSFQEQQRQALRFATPRSIRFTPQAPNDWRGIDLFASDDEPRVPSSRHVGIPQYRETAIGRPIENAEISGVRARKQSKNNGQH
jgi:hypothetical protein